MSREPGDCAVERFLAHKRALGPQVPQRGGRAAAAGALRRRASCRPARPADRRRCSTTSSRPGPGRDRAASITSSASSRGLLDWAVTQRAAARPRRCRPADAGRPPRASRSCSTPPRHGGCSTPPRRCRTTPRARQRGPTYRAIFALCYGLGLRAGEACGLRLGDVDPRPRTAGRARRQVRQEPPRPARAAHRRAARRAARAPPRRRRGRR